jgi:hypothetical protein
LTCISLFASFFLSELALIITLIKIDANRKDLVGGQQSDPII